MSDMETTIIPLDDAHEVLGVFGIGSNSKAYQRWRRDDGFRWGDLEDVLSESSLVLAVDWREWLQDAMDTIQSQLDSLGISAAMRATKATSKSLEREGRSSTSRTTKMISAM